VHRFGPECGALRTDRMPHLDVYPAYAPAFRHLPDILTWSQIPRRTLKERRRAGLGGALAWGIPRPTPHVVRRCVGVDMGPHLRPTG